LNFVADDTRYDAASDRAFAEWPAAVQAEVAIDAHLPGRPGRDVADARDCDKAHLPDHNAATGDAVLVWKHMARVIFWLAFAALTAAQSSSGFGGIWSLNRSLSEFPKELGFNADFMPADADPAAATPSGGRGRRGSTSGGRSSAPNAQRRESYEDGQRVRLFTEEGRNPPARLTIVDSAAAIIVTNELGQSRTLHPTNREESIEIQGVLVPVTTARDGTQLIVTYHVEQDRDVRYTYSPAASPARLVVETQFLDHGKGEKVTRVYEPGLAQVERAAPAGQTAQREQPARETFDQRPGAEFRGLKNVGVLVEDLGPEATVCGLKRDTLEDALARRLSAGGLVVRKNSDEDTYVYVNIITTSLPNGTCVSRYDAFLYTHGTAKLAYRDQPVLVQVSLMHRGGIGTTGLAAHAATVARGLETYIDVFVSQIQNANK